MESPRRVTLLIGRNGSVQLVPADDDDEGGGGGAGGGGAGLVAILALTFTCGLALNIAVAIAVATEPILRKALFLRCLATLAFANALDCALNVSVAGIAITSWLALSPIAASRLCRFSALTSQMTVLAQTWAILAMVLERVSSLASGSAPSAAPSTTSYVGVRGKEASIRAAMVASSALIWFAWPSAVTLAAAPALLAPVRIFPNRYGCGVAGPPGPSLWMTVAALAIGYLIPWACIVIVLASSARHVTRRRWRKQQLELAAQRRAANTTGAQVLPPNQAAPPPGQAPPPPALWFSPDDSAGFGSSTSAQLSLAAVLIFLYATLLFPQTLTTLTFQLVRVPLKRLPPPSTPEQWPANTGAYETVFVWMRFQFAVVSPGLVLLFHKEVRQRVESILTFLCRSCYCRRKKLTPTLNNETYERSADIRTPVLFATDQGLFLRVADQAWGDVPDEASTSVNVPTSWADITAGPRYVFQFCDVALLDDKAASVAGQLRPLLGDVSPDSARRPTGSKPADWSKKNVRFASVVSEIPSVEGAGQEATTAVMAPSPPLRLLPDSPVRWLPRNKRTTLELEIVTDDVNVIPVQPAAAVRAPPITIDSATFSLAPGKKGSFIRGFHV